LKKLSIGALTLQHWVGAIFLEVKLAYNFVTELFPYSKLRWILACRKYFVKQANNEAVDVQARSYVPAFSYVAAMCRESRLRPVCSAVSDIHWSFLSTNPSTI
jgi:hypothetical protein